MHQTFTLLIEQGKELGMVQIKKRGICRIWNKSFNFHPIGIDFLGNSFGINFHPTADNYTPIGESNFHIFSV